MEILYEYDSEESDAAPNCTIVVLVVVVVVFVVVVVLVVVVVSACSCRCEIDWKPGKNVTLKKVKKVQQHRSQAGAKRTVIKTVQNDSFFNFFSAPEGCSSSNSSSLNFCF